MGRLSTLRASYCALAFSGLVAAQAPPKVDFANDVLPILRQNCIGCHGSTQQMSGMRLDRKSVVMDRRGVVPGSSENSFLFHRISGTDFGSQMPPTGPLRPEQIKTIKTWIDQGAEWPDALANEAELPPINPKAVTMIDLLQKGDVAGFMKTAAAEPQLLNARGPEGSTPFMYAVLYTGKANVEKLLKLGADPNKKNDANATALMWAAVDLEKTRLLIAHKADVNVRSNDLRTALMIAARKPGNVATLKLLLDNGAKLDPNAHASTESSPLNEAATAGDGATVELLLARGASLKGAEPALEMSIAMRCPKCLTLLAAKSFTKDDYTMALVGTAQFGNASATRLLLERGADPNMVDPLGRTALMYAAASDLLDLDVVKLLVEHGADVNAKDAHKNGGDTGLSVLDIAKLHGDTPIVEFLTKSGAKPTPQTPPMLKVRRENTIASAVQTALPLLQAADANFMPKAACASCHNNSMAAMAVGAARSYGFKVDEKVATQQVQGNVFGLMKLRDLLRQGTLGGVSEFFGPSVVGYMLIGLGAEHYPADLNTDIAAMYLKNRQAPSGEIAYAVADTRPPICSDYIGQTAISLRAMQLYAPKADKAAFDQSIRLAATWIANAKARLTEDRIWRAQGLAWAGTDKAALQGAIRELTAVQKSDGSWSDVSSSDGTAYATGRALVALQAAGVPSTDAAYQKAVKYLLSTQQEDGSWFVRSRAMAFQPYFDAGFPHGFDQWISAAGSSWATLALTTAAQNKLMVGSRGR